MSSRLPTSRFSRCASSAIVLGQLARARPRSSPSRSSRLLAAPVITASGVRRSCETELSSVLAQPLGLDLRRRAARPARRAGALDRERHLVRRTSRAGGAARARSPSSGRGRRARARRSARRCRAAAGRGRARPAACRCRARPAGRGRTPTARRRVSCSLVLRTRQRRRRGAATTPALVVGQQHDGAGCRTPRRSCRTAAVEQLVDGRGSPPARGSAGRAPRCGARAGAPPRPAAAAVRQRADDASDHASMTAKVTRYWVSETAKV